MEYREAWVSNPGKVFIYVKASIILMMNSADFLTKFRISQTAILGINGSSR
jgi:hypothetical protein